MSEFDSPESMPSEGIGVADAGSPYLPQARPVPAAEVVAAPNPYLPSQPLPAGRAFFTKQGAWGLWWMVVITLGIYNLIWYHRVNRELAAALGRRHEAWGQWWCVLVPFYGIYGMYKTAQAVNDAHAAIGSPTRVGPVTACFWAPMWFASQTRYVQRRINLLADMHYQAANHASAVR
jgi:hypothetical protein